MTVINDPHPDKMPNILVHMVATGLVSSSGVVVGAQARLAG